MAEVRVPKAAELVAADLRRRIVLGELPTGEALPTEASLMERYGVSRPTLREAFRVLESESLIVVRRGSHGGARVQAPTDEVAANYAGLLLQYRGTALADIYEARNAIEWPLVRILGERGSSEDLARLQEIAVREQTVIDAPGEVTSLQTSFHQAVADLAGNKTLQLFSRIIGHFVEIAGTESISRAVGTVSQRSATHKGSSAHRRVAERLIAGDIDDAERVWHDHLLEAGEFVIRSGVASTLLEMRL